MGADEGLIKSFARKPITIIICAINIAVFVYLKSKYMSYVDVGISYRTLIHKKEWWRAVTSTFSHLDLSHLFLNVSSTYGYGWLEEQHGSWWYLLAVFFLFVMSNLFHAGFLILCFRTATRARRRIDTFSLGFSAVCFGLETLGAFVSKSNSFQFLGVSVQYWLAPFLSLALVQLIIPNASFWGHFSGIMAGFLYAKVLLFLFDRRQYSVVNNRRRPFCNQRPYSYRY